MPQKSISFSTIRIEVLVFILSLLLPLFWIGGNLLGNLYSIAVVGSFLFFSFICNNYITVDFQA